MEIQEIKKNLLLGGQFENESANWFTLSKPLENRRIIVINGKYKFYRNIDSYSKRISKLIKTGL